MSQQDQHDQELIGRYFDGELSELESRQLADRLRTDTAFREEFLRAGEIHGRLRWEFERQAIAEQVLAQADRPLHFRRGAVLALAATVAALGLLAAVVIPRLGPPLPATAERTPASPTMPETRVKAVARVIHQQDAEWGAQLQREVIVGEWVQPGDYKLAAGKIVLAFDAGSTVELDDFAEFTVLNERQMRLKSGRIQAKVIDPARGFTVLTSNGDIVDLGTEFVVAINKSGATDVGVIEGAVSAKPLHGQPHELAKDKRALITAKRVRSAPMQATLPMNIDFGFDQPVPYYHWSFNELENNTFAETGENLQKGKCPLREVVPVDASAPHLTKGVFGQAIQLEGNGSFLMSRYRGVAGNGPRTVAAWVRIPRHAPPETAYGWAGWGTHNDYDKAHKWQVSWNPQVKLNYWKQPLSPDAVQGAIRTEFGPGWIVGTTDLRDGRWHHVVSIFIGGETPDVATDVRQYVDGRLEGVSGYRSEKVDTWTTRVRSAPLIVGHHISRNQGDFFKGFQGAIDELYIFEGALTPAQVWQLYQENKPPAPTAIPPSLGTLVQAAPVPSASH